jgi:UDP-N-acetylmuramate dehydrogenase
MDLHPIAQELRARFPGLPVLEREPMARHCAFRIGGPAELFLEPADAETLAALLRILKEADVPCTVIGNGTNLLVADAGVRGAVLHLGAAFGGVRIEGARVTAEAGATLAQLATAARDAGLAGLEFAHGIPGSLGGAVIMNAGAYGGEMKDVVVSVRYLDAQGAVRETAEPDFGYRRSRFTGGTDVILGAALTLQPDDPAAIAARMTALWERRSASQPLNRPSAGSFFKRPATGYAAAMIDGAGLKGLTVGGAQVSEKHAGFLINAGGATCADVLALMRRVQAAVFDKYGVMLEPEVRFLG